ncbi:hypothetical protein [Marinobacter salarius]|jgi:hypothetical protein|uniref:hypothetical protein n=1 Tax=Marinobacter salarius TaxID=1420917 RepID=UPI0018F122C7|nr:hypothetical protein [Marinobacter salarius]MBJ7302490.1 hypothetical protein [Marinobacter salarius]HIO30759.1 hypothetical protein [Marinobacter salarius]HIP01742.1 hypothetical protein [Marinobacter salarius]
MTSLKQVQKILGYGCFSEIGRACKRSPPAVKKWFDVGVLPETEIIEVFGQRKTSYGLVIETLTGGRVTDAQLRQENYEYRQSRKSAA